MAYKTWYAVLKDENDRDFSVGSYDYGEANLISQQPEYDRDTVRITEFLLLESGKRVRISTERPLWVLAQIAY